MSDVCIFENSCNSKIYSIALYGCPFITEHEKQKKKKKNQKIIIKKKKFFFANNKCIIM